MAAAIKVAKTLKEGQRCVVLLPDSVRNYMTKFLSNRWMADHQFLDMEVDPSVDKMPWAKRPVADLPLRQPMVVLPHVTCKEVVALMNTQGIDQLPVVNDNNEIGNVRHTHSRSHTRTIFLENAIPFVAKFLNLYAVLQL